MDIRKTRRKDIKWCTQDREHGEDTEKNNISPTCPLLCSDHLANKCTFMSCKWELRVEINIREKVKARNR